MPGGSSGEELVKGRAGGLCFRETVEENFKY